MQTMKAYRIHAYGGPEVLQLDQVPIPTPAAGQVLVKVGAAGVNGLDWKVREGYVRDAFPLALPAILGIELAGVVAGVGPGVERLKLGGRVMGPLMGQGAYADFAVVDEVKLALTPEGLSDVEAAAIPVAALAAWQALRAAGELRAGRSVLILGAAGGVGGFAVQFAKAAGAVVLAVASAASADHVKSLGADVVIDRGAERFEDRASNVNLVLDLVGGEALERSWRVLAPDGVIVSTATPDIAARTPAGRKGQWFMMRPDHAQLRQIAEAVARGQVHSTLAEVVAPADLPAALQRNMTGHAPGKIVVDFGR
jgi:NADPH:quinone reductase-like Zn-dependent oxidoreductase